MKEPLLNAAEVATRLGLKERTIRAWIAERRIATVKLGASVRIPASEVDRFIKRGARPAVK